MLHDELILLRDTRYTKVYVSALLSMYFYIKYSQVYCIEWPLRARISKCMSACSVMRVSCGILDSRLTLASAASKSKVETSCGGDAYVSLAPWRFGHV